MLDIAHCLYPELLGADDTSLQSSQPAATWLASAKFKRNETSEKCKHINHFVGYSAKITIRKSLVAHLENMSNPFAPPRSKLTDSELPDVPQPSKVALAVRLLWTSLALGMPSFYEFLRDPEGMTFIVAVAFALGLIGLAAFVNLSVARGKNWARILLAALTVFEVVSRSFGPGPEDTIFMAVCDWIGAALDVVAVYLLFTSSASAWFKHMRNANLAHP